MGESFTADTWVINAGGMQGGVAGQPGYGTGYGTGQPVSTEIPISHPSVFPPVLIFPLEPCIWRRDRAFG